MSEREKLIELLNNAPVGYEQLGEKFYKHIIENIADYLIKNNVIVSPVKIGDTVYQRDGIGRLYERTVRKIFYDTPGLAFDEDAIGKTIFLTKEAALKGGATNE